MSTKSASFVVDGLRTAVGKGKPGGALHGIAPGLLLSQTLEGLLARNSEIAKEDVGDVMTGCVTPVGPQGGNIARLATLHSGMPHTVPATTINRMCGSSQTALNLVSAAVEAGDYDVGLASGIEMLSTVPFFADCDGYLMNNKEPDAFLRSMPVKLLHQGVSAELVAEKYGVTREECEVYSARSHEKALAQDSEALKAQVLAVENPVSGTTVTQDEGVRAPDLSKLAELKSVFKEGGVVTAGTASQISDGAAAVLVCSEEYATRKNLAPKARVVSRAVVGSDPELMLDGIPAAARKALAAAGLGVGEIDHFEINEAFACVVLAFAKDMDVDLDLINGFGGAIAHGHPTGATGAILATKIVHSVPSGSKVLQGMCIGHGQAIATVYEIM